MAKSAQMKKMAGYQTYVLHLEGKRSPDVNSASACTIKIQADAGVESCQGRRQQKWRQEKRFKKNGRLATRTQEQQTACSSVIRRTICSRFCSSSPEILHGNVNNLHKDCLYCEC